MISKFYYIMIFINKLVCTKKDVISNNAIPNTKDVLKMNLQYIIIYAMKYLKPMLGNILLIQ